MLDTTVYGVPSGNYDGSSLDWAGNAVTAADYYHGYGGLQTVTFSVSHFLGTMHVEATLDADAEDAAWFDTFTLGDNSSELNGKTRFIYQAFTNAPRTSLFSKKFVPCFFRISLRT